MRDRLIIAIDGPAGSGKSTVAKEVARRLGLLYVDTGAMYRALTLKAMRENVDFSDEAALIALAQKATIRLNTNEDNSLSVLLDGTDVSEAIRTAQVTGNVKYVARIPRVRERMVMLQRKAASSGKAVRQVLRRAQHRSKYREHSRTAHRCSNRPERSRGAVLEGRDIGTVVFPDADKKIYLDADPEERVKRRYKELMEKGHAVTVAGIEKDVSTRDQTDRTRETGALKKAEDAILIDTTGMTIAEVTERIIKEVEGQRK